MIADFSELHDSVVKTLDDVALSACREEMRREEESASKRMGRKGSEE